MVKLNQYVKKGDLLVSNTITSTSEVDKIIETEGTIKAYTYTTYEAKIDKKKWMMVKHLAIFSIQFVVN